MKKLLILLLFVCAIGWSQDRPIRADVVFLDTLTTTERDALTMRPGQFALIVNSTVDSVQVWNGVKWSSLGSGGSTLSDAEISTAFLNINPNTDLDSTNDVTLTGTQTITGIKTFDAAAVYATQQFRVNGGVDGYASLSAGNLQITSTADTSTWTIGNREGTDISNRIGIRAKGNWDNGVLEFDYGADDRWEIDTSPIITPANAFSLGILTTSDIDVNVQAYSPDLDLVTGTNTGDETEATIKTKIAAGTGFDDAHIADGGISPVKLSADNSPTDDADLTYESSTGNVVYATNRIKSNTTGLTNAVQITNIVAGNEADVSGWAVDANRVDIILDKKLIQEREIYLGPKGADIETGTSVEIWPVFDAITITEVAAFSGTAPTGSTAIFDINEDGVSILSTNLSIDATEKWSSTATSTAVISDTTVDANSVISFDIDQVGSTVPGTDVVIKIKYYLN